MILAGKLMTRTKEMCGGSSIRAAQSLVDLAGCRARLMDMCGAAFYHICAANLFLENANSASERIGGMNPAAVAAEQLRRGRLYLSKWNGTVQNGKATFMVDDTKTVDLAVQERIRAEYADALELAKREGSEEVVAMVASLVDKIAELTALIEKRDEK